VPLTVKYVFSYRVETLLGNIRQVDAGIVELNVGHSHGVRYGHVDTRVV